MSAATHRMWERFSSPSSLCSMNPTHFLLQMSMRASCIADGVTPTDAIMNIQILLGKSAQRIKSIIMDPKSSFISLLYFRAQPETQFASRFFHLLLFSIRSLYVCWWWFDLYRKHSNEKKTSVAIESRGRKGGNCCTTNIRRILSET